MTGSSRRPSADDLLILLAVGRTGKYTTAADELGLNHTTISRRIAALELAVGGRVLARVSGGWELTELGREALAAASAGTSGQPYVLQPRATAVPTPVSSTLWQSLPSRCKQTKTFWCTISCQHAS